MSFANFGFYSFTSFVAFCLLIHPIQFRNDAIPWITVNICSFACWLCLFTNQRSAPDRLQISHYYEIVFVAPLILTIHLFVITTNSWRPWVYSYEWNECCLVYSADHKTNAIVKCHRRRRQKIIFIHLTHLAIMWEKDSSIKSMCILTWHAFFRFYYLHSFAPSLSILGDCVFLFSTFLKWNWIRTLYKYDWLHWTLNKASERTGVWADEEGEEKNRKSNNFSNNHHLSLTANLVYVCSV